MFVEQQLNKSLIIRKNDKIILKMQKTCENLKS